MESNKKPLVIVAGKVRVDGLAKLAEGATIRQWQESTPMPRETLKEWLRDAVGLWSSKHIKVDADLLASAPNLKVVAQDSVGYDNIVISDLTAKGIPHGNTPHVLTDTVAELAFTLLAAASRRIVENVEFVKQGLWTKQRPIHIGRDLKGTTLGIIGLGEIGLAIAKRAQAFGMHILYHNRTRRKDDVTQNLTYCTKEELLAKSDTVLVMTPLTDATRGMIGSAEFALMKSEALFVNVGRGAVVDTSALVTALETGQIAYAALDVVDPEPLPKEHPLLATGKVMIVPHIGSFTNETRHEMALLTANNLMAGIHEEPLPACVNEEVNYK
ncbi:2-hydroxyacid dehydrogenase [Veillonella criceti]|uniref:Glyoxylate/hydroxypyruvate reductase B n=1 Tax=Veillonella criceti TaxID=103891 RepID=A0A380NQ13_9FIRM|nr:D-glycerate dehydrogenase [Veillonella criceti]SUP44913.1 Glyoxylate/hydroxypyruvate reductase B [Veillonella criceti]